MEEEYILDGKTYTASQLNQYANQSNLSLKDYIYESGATVKKVNKYMLDGKEYTDVQLNQYAKKSNLSLKDYIYESGATLKKKKSSKLTSQKVDVGSSSKPTQQSTLSDTNQQKKAQDSGTLDGLKPFDPLEGLLKAQQKTIKETTPAVTKQVQPTEEEDYFTGGFGNFLRGVDDIIPLGIGDFVDDMARGVASGYRQGQSAKASGNLIVSGTNPSDEEITQFIESRKSAEEIKPSAEMNNYQKIYQEEGKGFWGVVKGLINNPTVIPELLLSSLTSMATNTDAIKAGVSTIIAGGSIGAATGATGGSVVPVVGTGIGAGAGAIAGAEAAIPFAFGAASAVVEMGSTFGELLQEELGDKEMSKENVRAVLENPEKLQSIRNKAIARGLIIGTIDAFTGKLATGVGAKILTKSAAKSATGAVTKAAVVRATAAGAGVESFGGSFGETAARTVIGQDMDISEIALEGLAELPGGIRSTIQAKFAKPSYKVNGEKVSKDQIDNLIETMTPTELAKTKIEIKNDYEGRQFKIQDKIVTNSIKEDVRKANPELNEPSLNAITQLEKDLQGLEGNKTQTGKDKSAAIRAQIKNIQENQLQDEAASEYIINDKKYSKEDFLKELEGKTPDELKAIKIAVNNDEQTAKNINEKFKTDAVQEQSTTEVPIQSETTTSETMETGVSESGPEVTTEQVTQPQENLTIVESEDGFKIFNDKTNLYEEGTDEQGIAPSYDTREEAEARIEELLAPTETPTETTTDVKAEEIAQEVAIPDWERERHDGILESYKEEIADNEEKLKKEKGKNFFSRSRSNIKYYEDSIKWYENQSKLLKENPIEYYKDFIKSVEENHNEKLKDKSKDDNGKTYKERVIEDYGTTDFNVVEAYFIEDTNRRISDYEGVQKTANENAQNVANETSVSETPIAETKAEAAPVAETTNEKKIAEATKKLADKVREIKVSRPDIFSSGTPGSLAWDLGVEAVAKSIEITGDIAQAVSDGIEAIKKTDWYKGLDNDKKTVVEEEFKKKFNSLKENIDEQGQQAISQGSTTMKDFFDYMSNNEDFNNLSESEKKDFYYNSVSTFSTSEAISQEEDSRKTIVLKDQNWVKKLLTTFQNKMLRVKDVQNQIEEILGTKILNEANAALKFELLVGKAKYLIDNIRYEISDRKNKNSFYNRLISDGGDIDDLGIYMYALHAPERNEAVSNQRKEEFDNEVTVLNQKIADAKSKSLKTRYQNQLNKLVSGRGKTTILKGPGSGMTNEQAQDIIDTVEKSGKKDLYDKYAKEFRDKVITPNLDAMLNYELIDQETYDLVKNKYTNYVPLQVVEKSLNKITGSGIRGASVKGRDIFKARGSDLYKYTDRYNPIFSTMFAYTNTILRGERNKASQALINLAEMDENNDVFKIHRPKYIPIVNSNGDIDFIIEGTSDIVKNNSVEIKSKGKPIYIEIKDKALRDAINQQGVVRGIRGLHIVNTWLRNTATLFNPDFIFTNIVRDIQGSAFNIQSSKKDFDLKKITRKIINPKNLISAGRGIISAGKKDFNSEWSIAARELAENGGVVSWFQADNLDDYINDLKKDLLKVKRGENKFYKVLNKTKDTLLMAQLVAEQSVRLSTFKALKDAGVPLEEAAREAKNITVNFENKGTWSGFVDSLYIFATAGISGTVRTAYSLSKSKKARGIAAGIFSYGILESVMNNALAAGDDEDELIEDGIKERNLVIVNPSDPKKEPLLIPLAYGINVFKHAGNLTYDVAMGRKTALEGSTKLFKSIYTQISPFYGPTVGQAISPTMLDPIVQHLENKNWLGNPIKPEQPKFGSNVKESDLYFQSVRSTSKWATKKLNEITGGTAVESGSIDISPEILDHYYDAFTGGTGKFISNSYYTGNAILQESLYGDKVKEDEQISLRKLPFLKSFFGSKPSDKKINYIYEIFGRSGTEEISEKEMIKFKDMYKSARKEGLIDRENAQKMKKQIIKNQIKIKKYKEIQDLKLKDMNKKQRLEYKKNNTSN